MLASRIPTLLQKGEWLTNEEVIKLYHDCMSKCLAIMDQVKENTVPLKVDDALAFQAHLIVLFMLTTGGQRKQVTTLFIYKNMLLLYTMLMVTVISIMMK